MPTLSSWREGKLVHSIATNMQFAGNQCLAIFQFHSCARKKFRNVNCKMVAKLDVAFNGCPGGQTHLQLYQPGGSRALDRQHAKRALEDEQHGEQMEIKSAERQLVQQDHARRCDAVSKAWQHLRRRWSRSRRQRSVHSPSKSLVAWPECGRYVRSPTCLARDAKDSRFWQPVRCGRSQRAPLLDIVQRCACGRRYTSSETEICHPDGHGAGAGAVGQTNTWGLEGPELVVSGLCHVVRRGASSQLVRLGVTCQVKQVALAGAGVNIVRSRPVCSLLRWNTRLLAELVIVPRPCSLPCRHWLWPPCPSAQEGRLRLVGDGHGWRCRSGSSTLRLHA